MLIYIIETKFDLVLYSIKNNREEYSLTNQFITTLLII